MNANIMTDYEEKKISRLISASNALRVKKPRHISEIYLEILLSKRKEMQAIY